MSLEDDSLNGSSTIIENKLPEIKHKKLTGYDKIKIVLKEGALTQKQLRSKTGLQSIGDLRTRLNRLMESNEVEQFICGECCTTLRYRLK